ncbi:hypothetical protein NDU88_004498 [Pleurodeles waltl]|uniref:Uncharacterized protein n=1 Tax=Pleurodeles waltl TaxID=8319 RepID=A0AAV7VHA4_PLEWA|nr:hypothetical protein NDU88_004498 [Pleurodeles waltl]
MAVRPADIQCPEGRAYVLLQVTPATPYHTSSGGCAKLKSDRRTACNHCQGSAAHNCLYPGEAESATPNAPDASSNTVPGARREQAAALRINHLRRHILRCSVPGGGGGMERPAIQPRALTSAQSRAPDEIPTAAVGSPGEERCVATS